MKPTDRSADALGFRITPRLILGLFALVAGALLILDNAGLLYAWDYLRFWPVLLILVGLIKMTQPGGSRFFGFLLALAGAWLLADVLDVAEFDFDYVWPIILVVAGLNLLASEIFRRTRRTSADTGAEVDLIALLGGTKRASAAQSFRGGTCTAIMGGCELDLRQAAIKPGEVAVVDTFALWGGVEIVVPETWEVELKGIPIMGAFEDKTRHPVGPGPHQRLVVKGMAIMGGVEVKNLGRREA